MSVSFNWDSWGSCEAEIGNFKNIIFWDEKILWFEISMKYFFGMAMVDALEKLITEALA